MDVSDKLVAIELGMDAQHYADYDNAVGYGGVDQILLRDENVVIVHKEMEVDVRKTIADATKYYSTK